MNQNPTILIDGIEQRLTLSKVTAIKANVPFVLHLDRLDDGTYRMTYNAMLIPDLTQVKGFVIERVSNEN